MFFNLCIRPSNRSSSNRFLDSNHQQLLLLCHLAASSKHIPLLRPSRRSLQHATGLFAQQPLPITSTTSPQQQRQQKMAVAAAAHLFL
uniref:Uncharacterized protein n=1 Tax=Mesocestoides corti TaxID=53468 RepID=A0A5K3G1V1_MESCO